MGFRHYLKYLLIFIVIGVISVSIYFAVKNDGNGEDEVVEEQQESVEQLIETPDDKKADLAENDIKEEEIGSEIEAPEILDKGYYRTSMKTHPDYSIVCPDGWELFSENDDERILIKKTGDRTVQTVMITAVEKSMVAEVFEEGLFESYRSNALEAEEAELLYDEYIEISGDFQRLSGYKYKSRLGEDEPECMDYISSLEHEEIIYIFKYIGSNLDRETARENFLGILATFNLEPDAGSVKNTSESPSVNILILGDDSAYDRAGGRVSGRTDIIMIFHLNLETHEGSIVTIPRDTWVEIPGHGEGKINGAHAIGGNELTVQTIEDFSGLEIDNYIITDFDGFVPLIDFLGGVTVEVTEDLADGFSGCYLSEGIHHLDGEQALALCRNRHREGGAYARENEAAKVILALNEQKTTLQKIMATPLYINMLLNYTWTDMTIDDFIKILPALGNIDSGDIVVTSIPSWPQMVGNASAVVYDEQATAELFEEIKAQ